MKIGKLDRRFKGHQTYKYFVEYRIIKINDFVEARQWCWKSFGPSSEIDTLHLIKDDTKVWAWDIDDFRVKILLKSDVEYSWFRLRFDGATTNKIQ